MDDIAIATRLQSPSAGDIVFLCRSTRRQVMIRGVKIVSIPVRNQDVALKFYTEKLGFKVATDQEMAPGGQRWIELMIPGSETNLALFTPPGYENRIGGFHAMTFWTDDVFATAEQ